MHAPDLLADPHLDRIVSDRVLRPVRQASGGTADVPEGLTSYRIATLHHAAADAYQRSLDWWTEHPLPAHRGPAGRTEFGFHLLTESTEVTR